MQSQGIPMSQLLQSTQEPMIRKKRFKALVIFLLVVLSVVIIGYGYQLKINRDIHQVGQHVLILLEDRYHKKFAIKTGRYEWNIKTYEFMAYPKDNPALTFAVLIGGKNSTNIIATYIQRRINVEAKAMVRPFLEAITKKYAFAGIGVSANTPGIVGLPKGADDAALYDLHHNHLNLAQWVNRHAPILAISIQVDFNLKLTAQNLQQILKVTYQLTNYLQQQDYGEVFIGFGFYYLAKGANIQQLSTALLSRFSLEYRKYKEGNLVINSRRAITAPKHSKADKFGHIFSNDLKKINNLNDIAQFISLFNPSDNTYTPLINTSIYQTLLKEAGHE